MSKRFGRRRTHALIAERDTYKECCSTFKDVNKQNKEYLMRICELEGEIRKLTE